jgi:hypothetical protein
VTGPLVRVRCKACGESPGAAADAVTFTAQQRPAGGAESRRRLPAKSPLRVDLQAPAGASIAVWCSKHGDLTVPVAEVARAAVIAQRRQATYTIRVTATASR